MRTLFPRAIRIIAAFLLVALPPLHTLPVMTMTLAQKLATKQFVLTAEITPPVSFSRDELLDKALPLKGLADAVNVTDGAGARPHLGAVTSAGILVEKGIEPILQLTCRDRNRIGLQSELMSAAALGVRNLLVLRGDDPSAGDQPDAKPVFDVDARVLMRTATTMRDAGELPTGRKVGGQASFFIGAADSPIDPKPDWTPKGLLDKIAAGAQFAQTQFCMDAGLASRYVTRLAEHGVPRDFYVILGVAVLRSARSARWIRDNLYGSIIPDALIERLEGAQDQAAEGRRIAQEYLNQLAELPGISGAHLMAPLHEDAIPAVISGLGWKDRMRAR
jgi:methylenetetrahydrofolate reductase (NADPH)